MATGPSDGRSSDPDAGRPARLIVCLLKCPLAGDALASALAQEFVVRHGRSDLWATSAAEHAGVNASEASLVITDRGGPLIGRLLDTVFGPVPVIHLVDEPPYDDASDCSPRRGTVRRFRFNRDSTVAGLAAVAVGLVPCDVAGGVDVREGPAVLRGRQAAAALSRLKPRLRELVRKLAAGKTLGESAAGLAVSRRTAENMKYAAMRELGVRTQAGLVRLVIEAETALRPPAR